MEINQQGRAIMIKKEQRDRESGREVERERGRGCLWVRGRSTERERGRFRER